MCDQQMEVDPVETMQFVSASYSLELVPRVDDSNTHFSDLSPMERCIFILLPLKLALKAAGLTTSHNVILSFTPQIHKSIGPH